MIGTSSQTRRERNFELGMKEKKLFGKRASEEEEVVFFLA